MPDGEALMGFAMPSVPAVVLCVRELSSIFLPQAVIISDSVTSLLHGPAQGCHRPGVRAREGAGEKRLGSLPLPDFREMGLG